MRTAISMAVPIAAVVLVGCTPLRAAPAPHKDGINTIAFAQSAGAMLTVDGATRYQTIDGFGVNANPKNWDPAAAVAPNAPYPPLAPALGQLVGDLGATLWRVDVYGTSDWEETNDNADPFTPDWTYYNNLYGNRDGQHSQFSSLWATLHQLNAQGVQPILSASGVVPAWMGGSTINNDDEFVETFTTLLSYARDVEHINFTLADPLNETDLGPPEGPSVTASHMVTLLRKLRARLHALGMDNVRLVVPETSRPNGGFNGAILGDAQVAPYVRAYAGHAYSYTDVTDEVSQIQGSSYPASFWMSEYSTGMYGALDNPANVVTDEWAFAEAMTAILFPALTTGADGAMVWDAYDNIHDHAGNYTKWGLLDTLNGYQPRKRYYAAKQVFRYVPVGSTRVSADTFAGGVQLLAFTGPGAGKLAIVGMNTGSQSVTFAGMLNGVPGVTALSLYQTTATLDAQYGGTTTVSNGAFSVTVAPDSIFTLTTTTPTPCANDADGDGVCDAVDNCANIYNPSQANSDGRNHLLHLGGEDALGDACDDDIDGDGYTNAEESFIGTSPGTYCDRMRADLDGNGIVNANDLAWMAGKFNFHGALREDQNSDRTVNSIDLALAARTEPLSVFNGLVTACP